MIDYTRRRARALTPGPYRAGLATVQRENIKAGSQSVGRVTITEAGRKAIENADAVYDREHVAAVRFRRCHGVPLQGGYSSRGLVPADSGTFAKSIDHFSRLVPRHAAGDAQELRIATAIPKPSLKRLSVPSRVTTTIFFR
jgi:hypothetical protein